MYGPRTVTAKVDNLIATAWALALLALFLGFCNIMRIYTPERTFLSVFWVYFLLIDIVPSSNLTQNDIPSSQYKRRGAIMHPCIQVSGSIPQQYLEDAHRVGRHGRVQRRAARVVLRVGVRARVQQTLGGVGARVSVGDDGELK